MLDARSPKYPALFDPESGVRFRRGRAEVTEEQAKALAKRRFVDGILVNGLPAKKWLQAQNTSADAPPEPANEPSGNELPESVPDERRGRGTRKAN